MIHSTGNVSTEPLLPSQRSRRRLRGHSETAADTSIDFQRRLRRIRRMATLLDTSIRVPGTSYRFGLDSLAGLLPAVGDSMTAALSVYLVYEASRLGISKKALMKMLLNVAVDLGLGSVPIAGDAFDFFYKANRRNVRLLEAELRQREMGKHGEQVKRGYGTTDK